MKIHVCCVRERVVTDVLKARILRNVGKNLPKDTVSHLRQVFTQRHSVTSQASVCPKTQYHITGKCLPKDTV
jgi:hypothetical protein